MNRFRTAKNQTQKSLFQRLTGKLCPKPLISTLLPMENSKMPMRSTLIMKKQRPQPPINLPATP
jgi:hypothetical protein